MLINKVELFINRVSTDESYIDDIYSEYKSVQDECEYFGYLYSKIEEGTSLDELKGEVFLFPLKDNYTYQNLKEYVKNKFTEYDYKYYGDGSIHSLWSSVESSDWDEIRNNHSYIGNALKHVIDKYGC